MLKAEVEDDIHPSLIEYARANPREGFVTNRGSGTEQYQSTTHYELLIELFEHVGYTGITVLVHNPKSEAANHFLQATFGVIKGASSIATTETSDWQDTLNASSIWTPDEDHHIFSLDVEQRGDLIFYSRTRHQLTFFPAVTAEEIVKFSTARDNLIAFGALVVSSDSEYTDQTVSGLRPFDRPIFTWDTNQGVEQALVEV